MIASEAPHIKTAEILEYPCSYKSHLRTLFHSYLTKHNFKMQFKTSLVLVVLAVAGVTLASAASSPSIEVVGSSRLFAETNGIVTNLTRCGGFGTPIQLRISGCDGRCSMIPGNRYDIEYDLMPSSAAPSLSVACDLVYQGIPIRIFEMPIEGSSVQPGYVYTVKFYIVPNDVLSGQTALFRTILYHTDNRLLEICIEMEVDIL